MSLLELFIKNNCRLKESWKDYSINDSSILKNILLKSKVEPFCYANKYFNKTQRQGFIEESCRIKQVLHDLETIILPHDIINHKTTVLKSPNNDEMYFSDDKFAKVLFSYDEKTNCIEVYDIYTGLIYELIDNE